MDGAESGNARDARSRGEQMEAIVAEYEMPLLRYAARIVNSPTAAQDVVQNVFIKLFKVWQEGTHPTDKIKPWLYRVTHNEAVDFVRKESRLHDLHERHAEEKRSECPNGAHCSVTGDERKTLVLQYLRFLKPREQQVLLLRLEEGLSYREIGEVTGRTEGNVGNILHHGVRKLSARLKAAGVVG